MASVPALQMKERAAKAYAAMEALELSRQTITPILKQLLKTYNNEWDFIEAENYRLLADAAFEQQEAQQTSKKAPNGPVTRARRVNFEVDAGYEDLSDRSPLSGSPAGSRADTACPVNVAQGIEYHSGMNVRSRAVGRIEQGSRGTRGRLAVTNSATAAHGLDKGKSPLVADSPSTFRDSRWGESGNTGYVPKLVSVKLEATGVVAEGFEKVSFERVDGVIVPAVRKLQNSAVTAIKNIDCGTHPLLKRVKLEVCEEQPMTKNLNGSTHAPCIEKGGEARFLGPEAADGCGHQDITSGCTSSHLLMITAAGSSVEQQPMEEDDGTVFTSLVDYESEGEFPDPVQEDSGVGGVQAVSHGLDFGDGHNLLLCLQVFFTNKGKGWGIRTTEELPSGAFVCEYVGEILTNMELDKRNQEMKEADIKGHKGEHKDTYPVLLDGDWCSERGLKDEEALCLDATNYGNVARFINHRCFDANLIDIPVTIESQDRHYYHVAFFTNRHVSAGEELTWDYKIDFEDNDHPIEAFRCLCGSELCRGGRTGGLKKHKK